MRPPAGDVVLYTTPGCHLCDDARELLKATGVPFREVDASGDSTRFLRTPVIEADGVVAGEGEIDPALLRRALRRA